ncbi:MAG TPA: transporter substrate-binding domain-containing protein [Azospirillum sp.]|nr:transporter substrate-binding domain-containing protein [Azospirillum sp.]
MALLRRLIAIVMLVTGGVAQAAPLDAVVEKGVLRIAVYADFPPFSDRSGGRLDGVDVEIGRRIAEGLGVKPDFLVLTADESVADDLRNGVWKGSKMGGGVADVMLHVPYDREFAATLEAVHIFGTYFDEELVVARRTAPATLAHLKGEKIAVETDSIGDLYLGYAFNGALREGLLHYMTYREMAAALFDGTADAMVGPRSQVEAALGDKRGAYAVVAPATPGLMKRKWTLGMAVREDSRDLAYAVEDVIARLKEDGTLQSIFAERGLTWLRPEGP